ncbi:MAG: LptF/LptG family permease [Candidatus Hydrogenedentota bacterium]
MMKIIDRYLLKILLHGFSAALGIVAGLLILQRLYKIIELAITRSLDGFQTVSLILWTLPLVFFYSLPLASIVGTLLTFGRLSGDSELHAAMAAGISRKRLALYPTVFAAIIAILALLNNMVLMPLGYVRFDSIGFGVGIDPMQALRPGIVERIAGRHVLVGAIDPDNKTFRQLLTVIPSEDVGRKEGGSRLVCLAREGSWEIEGGSIKLFLGAGSIRELNDTGGPWHVMKFSEYSLHLPLPRDRSTHPKRLTAMQLLTQPKREHDIEFARRALEAIAIPLLVLCAIPLAIPSGASAARSGGTRGAIFVTLLLYFLYWIFNFGSDSIVAKYSLSPLALAIPHVLLAVLAASLWKRRL